jgi:hypothetical protein
VAPRPCVSIAEWFDMPASFAVRLLTLHLKKNLVHHMGYIKHICPSRNFRVLAYVKQEAYVN